MTLLNPSRRAAIRQRLETTWRSADVDVRYLLAALDTAEARIRELEAQLADPDSNDDDDDSHLAPYTVEEVRRMRETAAKLDERYANSHSTQLTALREGITTLREEWQEASDTKRLGTLRLTDGEASVHQECANRLADLLTARTTEPK